ncbi:MAG TPA: GNAT family protein [Bacteroidia bacterium]|nr:GNAT family protein [Bacteroidia bacterium]
MQLTNGIITLRAFETADAENICLLANNKKISGNLRDVFPSPYSIEDAYRHVKNSTKDPIQNFCISYQGKAVGSIGLFPQQDVYRYSAELGYWIGEPYWGKGLMVMAVNLIVPYGFEVLKMKRIYADVFSGNPNSMRVLEKCGFINEGTFKDSVFKDGKFLDSKRYAKTC